MTVDANTAANRVIALALLADSQLARAIHVADDARAEARAREEARRRQEEADRVFREQQARAQWGAFESRHRSAAGEVRSAHNSLTSMSIMAGALTAAATLVGAFCCVTVWLIAPTTYLESPYFFGVYGIGESLAAFLWLPLVLGVATGFVSRWVPAISLLSVPAIAWIVYESGPAVTPSGSLGSSFSDFVEGLGEWIIWVAGLGSFASIWLIWVAISAAGKARSAQKKTTSAEAKLREIQSNQPAVPRPDVAG